MKALEWHRFFLEQERFHGKTVFSVSELANAARSSAHAVNTELARLLARGIVHRYAKGLYGANPKARPEEIVHAIDSCAYITGLSALSRFHLATQQPTEVTCFTNRRHNRLPAKSSSRVQLRFYRVPAHIYARPEQGVFANAEQAICDFIYLAIRERLDPRHLVTFRNLHLLRRSRLKKIAQRYPLATQKLLEEMFSAEFPG